MFEKISLNMANISHPFYGVWLTFLELRDPLQEGVERALGALAVRRRLVVELAPLLFQFGHLPEELALQRSQTLPQQLS